MSFGIGSYGYNPIYVGAIGSHWETIGSHWESLGVIGILGDIGSHWETLGAIGSHWESLGVYWPYSPSGSTALMVL